MRQVIFDGQHNWTCPECHRDHVTVLAEPHTPLHQCPRLRGVWAPFVPAGVKAHLVLNDREDYVGKEMVHTDGHGRPVMSVTTLRDEGQDCTVYAPCAVADLRSEGAH